MAVSKAVSETSPLDEEKDVLELLEKIEDIASNAELEQALYEFRGLLPKLESPRRIVDTYLALRQSDYFSTALSLVAFVIQCVHACPVGLLGDLQKHVRRNSTYETDEHIPSFMLRLTLADIATGLMSASDRSQAADFITLAASHLKVNADKFDGLQLLKVFDTLEKRGHLNPEDATQSLICTWLTNIERPDLVETLKGYYPYRPIKLVVDKKVQRKSC